jgi:hypothetical protein
LKEKSIAINGTDGSYTIQAVMPPGLTIRSTLVAPAESGNAVSAAAIAMMRAMARIAALRRGCRTADAAPLVCRGAAGDDVERAGWTLRPRK